jgi:hypothetical protein
LRIAFEELLRRLPDIEPDPDRPSISNTAQVRGVLELHTRFTPEAPTAQPADAIQFRAGRRNSVGHP